MNTCEIDTAVPLPSEAGTNFLALRERAAAACASANLLKDWGIDNSEPADKEKAKEMLLSIAKGAEPSIPDQKRYLSNPENARYLDSILTEFDMEVVRNAQQLRTYVTNKLVIETTDRDARVRLKALELLGKITDVGLFTDKTEVTINSKSNAELESIIKDKLHRLMTKAEATDVVPRPSRIITAESEFEALMNLKGTNND